MVEKKRGIGNDDAAERGEEVVVVVETKGGCNSG